MLLEAGCKRVRDALWLGCGMVLLFALSLSVQAASLPDVIDKVKPSVVAVGIYSPTGSPRHVFKGTGFVVGNGHQVVTNYHVLPQSLNESRKEKIAVFSGRGKKVRYHEATVVARDPLHDLAILKIFQPLPAMKLAKPNSVREGEEIAFTGFPLGMVLGLYPVTHRGIVSAITPRAQPQVSSKLLTAKMVRAMRNPSNVLQLDATAYPGNSGSALYEQHSGKVVGVINSVLVKSTKESAISDPTGISYAIPVEFVHKLLKEVNR